jgi:molybdopterin converting factor small subunit
MPVLHIPNELRAYCGGADSVELEGETVSDVITGLAARFPELESRVLDASGALAPHLVVIQNDAVLRPGDAARARVSAGDELRLMSAVSGG